MKSKETTLNDYYSRFRKLMQNAISGSKQVMMTDDLPGPLMSQTESIENSDAIPAIGGYLSAIEVGPIYPFILSLMFPKALLCGFIDFAYEVLAYSEYFHKQIGPGHKTLFGYVTWRETTARVKFDKCIIDLKNEEDRRKSSNNKLLLCSGNKVLYYGSLHSFMNEIVERRPYEQFDLEFAEGRINNLIDLHSELRKRKIITD